MFDIHVTVQFYLVLPLPSLFYTVPKLVDTLFDLNCKNELFKMYDVLFCCSFRLHSPEVLWLTMRGIHFSKMESHIFTCLAACTMSEYRTSTGQTGCSDLLPPV